MADFQLVYNCPGCGKPTQTPEGSLTNRCEYCDLVVRIGAPHRILKYFYQSKIDPYGARMAADRYLKKEGLPLTGNIIRSDFYYLPFYRFRGMAIDYLAPATEYIEQPEGDIIPVKTRLEMKGKDFDVTVPAFSNEEFGLTSLGIRPHAVSLYAFSQSEVPGEAIIVNTDISPTLAEDQANELHKHNVGLYSKSLPVCSAMIGEQISVIYFPVWALIYESSGGQNTIFVDALAKRGYARLEKSFEYKEPQSNGQNSCFIQIHKHQCPECGADLQEKHFSLFYPCRNCNRSFLLSGEGYKQITCMSAAPPVGEPYWRFPLEFHHQRSYKLVKDFSNLLTSELALLRKQRRDNQFYLYSPAFKATDVTRWAKLALGKLATQPHHKLTEKIPADGPVFCIDEEEAKQMAVFLWQSAIAKYPRLHKDEFYLDEEMLPPGEVVWLPIDDFQLLANSAEFREVDVLNR